MHRPNATDTGSNRREAEIILYVYVYYYLFRHPYVHCPFCRLGQQSLRGLNSNLRVVAIGSYDHNENDTTDDVPGTPGKKSYELC
eukprot:scaffold314261_cov63-Attheya_sp.AAC.1